MSPSVSEISEQLRAASDRKSRAWWSNYVKEGSPFLGAPTRAIRRIVRQSIKFDDTSPSALEAAVDLAFSLLEATYSEQKIAGMLILQEFVIPAGREVPSLLDNDRIATLFDAGHIRDWNICDWFCVRVTGQLIAVHGDVVADPVLKWCRSTNLWRARASVVSFVPVVDSQSYHERILDAARVLITREERFAKTGVGWILREISSHNKPLVEAFIKSEIRHFSVESLRNATKYFGNTERKSLIDRLRTLD